MAQAATPAVEPPPKVFIYDHSAVQILLDDAVRSVFEEKKFVENHSIATTKAILGVLGCAIATYGYFNLLVENGQKWLLAACIVSYFLISAAYQYMTSFVQKDWIYEARNPQSDIRIKIRAKLDTEKGNYELELVDQKGVLPNKKVTPLVTKYITKGGVFSPNEFKTFVAETYYQFSSGR